MAETTSPAGAQWCATTKVCYRVGQDMNNLEKVQMAVEKYEIFEANLVINDMKIPPEEFLKIESNGYLLPLRHPKTGDSLFLIMAPPEGEKLPIEKPKGVLYGWLPSDEELPMWPGEAPPGGKWRETHFCGPVTLCLGCCPCCWLCLLGLGRGGPVDIATVYDSPDGLVWNKLGNHIGSTPENVEKPNQQVMAEK